jgi:hypothetical protein
MWIIEKEETKRWLSIRGLLDSTGGLSLSGFVQVINCAIPPDSGRKTALSKLIASFFDTDDEALLWINEFGIWESSEDRNLFDRFRRSLGEDSPLHEKPGHIFRSSELSDVSSLLAMVLYFIWGAVLYSPAKGLLVKISHDEFITMHARKKEDTSTIVEKLKKYLE